MAPVLIIHADSGFARRIGMEAGAQAVVVPTMKDANSLVQNSSASFSGIYLNPADAGSSALDFIESVLVRRPATPMFLFDPDADSLPETARMSLRNLHIRAVFSGRETFEELLRPLHPDPGHGLGRLEEHPSPAPVHPGFVPVPVMDLARLPRFPFDLFVEDDARKLCLIGVKDNPIERDYLATLALNTSWVYISEKAVSKVRARLDQARSDYMNLEGVPSGWKTAETLYETGCILNEIERGTSIESLTENAGALVSRLFQLIMTSGGAGLSGMLEMAKGCDRTILCTTYALLISKILRYERDSTVEILGMASLLQDHALRVSPFGNLVDARLEALSPEARAYYERHPMRSADLVAKTSEIPEVTRQVIRQHHERPDRGGFPNRVGGPLLHPMAEMLSLINLYLDLGPRFHQNRDAHLARYSDGLSRAFKTFLDIVEPR
ncbi:MAG: hypothetical protein EBX52_02345 [Proteobacteria bacterium]|nr:hypothetical protein [Pseudomonadota bacterium]